MGSHRLEGSVRYWADTQQRGFAKEGGGCDSHVTKMKETFRRGKFLKEQEFDLAISI